VRELTEGVWQLPALVPNLINCYLVRTTEGDVLIDAGTRWGASRLLRALADRPPALLALTHVHPDHQGAAAEVCRRFEVPLACHEADADAMEGRRPMQPANLVVRLGTRLWSGPPYPVARRLRDGDRIGEWRVVHAPGHTMGHVIYFRDQDRVAIAGDVVRHSFLRVGKWIEPPRMFCADAELNRQSIRKLIELHPSLVCFGHGPPARLAAVLEVGVG
jgi:glyoxylase-like metal-dependent hydrolase (beta-lactamase superfamily II)